MVLTDKLPNFNTEDFSLAAINSTHAVVSISSQHLQTGSVYIYTGHSQTKGGVGGRYASCKVLRYLGLKTGTGWTCIQIVAFVPL